MRKKSWYHKKKKNSYSQTQMIQQNCLSGRDYEFREPTPRREQTARSEGLSGELQGEPEELRPPESRDDAGASGDLWSIQGDFIYRPHNEHRVQFVCRKKKHSLFHWKIFLSRGPLTQIWTWWKKNALMTIGNVDENRSLSHSWKGFTKCTLLSEKPLKVYMLSRWTLTNAETTTRPDHVWPEVRSKIGKAVQNRENKNRKMKNRKFDNARRLKGVYSIDPIDEECEETINNARKRLEVLVEPAMPCRNRRFHWVPLAPGNWCEASMHPRRFWKQDLVV